MSRVLAVLGALVVLAGITWAIVATEREGRAWSAWCESRGGHVVKRTEPITTVSGSGVSTGVETNWFCLTADGRLLGIR